MTVAIFQLLLKSKTLVFSYTQNKNSEVELGRSRFYVFDIFFFSFWTVFRLSNVTEFQYITVICVSTLACIVITFSS